ncbi:MAG: aldo/keto reductase family protein [Planctomycetota bacterium]
MQYRNLGSSGLRVSTVAVGTWLTFGGRLDELTERELVRKAFDLGINFFDTADVYKGGRAETALQYSLKPYSRKDYVLASKVYFPMGDGPNDRGLSRKHIDESIHASLERLGTSYLDLYQAHRFDENTPLEETVRAFGDLIARGLILYWGVSCWSAEQIREACRIARAVNVPQPISNQPSYSLLDRAIEKEVLPACRDEGLGILPFSPMAQGVLTGKYLDNQRPADSRAVDNQHNQFMGDVLAPDALQKVARMAEASEECGIPMAQLALAWCLKDAQVSSVIAGVTKVAQLEQNAAAAEITLPEDVARLLDRVFSP